MRPIIRVSIVLAALCSHADARDPRYPPVTTDEFTAVCWYEMLAGLCDFPITERQRAAMESIRKKIRSQSVDGEEVTARVMCASFRDDLKRGIEHVCTPITKEHVLKTLSDAADREGSAPK